MLDNTISSQAGFDYGSSYGRSTSAYLVGGLGGSTSTIFANRFKIAKREQTQYSLTTYERIVFKYQILCTLELTKLSLR